MHSLSLTFRIDKKLSSRIKLVSQFNVVLALVVVIQWITSCHKNRMSTRVITLWRIDVMSLTTSVSTMHFLLEILSF